MVSFEKAFSNNDNLGLRLAVLRRFSSLNNINLKKVI
jgi:hypothetical protein